MRQFSLGRSILPPVGPCLFGEIVSLVDVDSCRPKKVWVGEVDGVVGLSVFCDASYNVSYTLTQVRWACGFRALSWALRMIWLGSLMLWLQSWLLSLSHWTIVWP